MQGNNSGSRARKKKRQEGSPNTWSGKQRNKQASSRIWSWLLTIRGTSDEPHSISFAMYFSHVNVLSQCRVELFAERRLGKCLVIVKGQWYNH